VVASMCQISLFGLSTNKIFDVDLDKFILRAKTTFNRGNNIGGEEATR